MNLLSYQMYEMAHMAVAPARAAADAARRLLGPFNPASLTPLGRNLSAAAEVFERATRRYGKPSFGLATTTIDGATVAVSEEIVWRKPFCRLVHFAREGAHARPEQPSLLIVAPMSGHYATLLRGTVEAFLPRYEVYVTDWTDARMAPLAVGRFDLDDYVDHLIEICAALATLKGARGVHTLGVCQPAVPLMAAVARMEAEAVDFSPASMILMGGPIDTRRSPTAVNQVAQERGVDFFAENCIVTVPFPYPGMGRRVYPGFLQLSGFMAMNLDRHVNAHVDMFKHLVKGDGDSAEKHRDFYDEYMAVMDLTEEYYLQTVDAVFVRHALPKGELTHRGVRVDPGAIRRVGLMTIEGENDDISGVGQTAAAQDLCRAIPDAIKTHHLQEEVGHYGVFNGSRFRNQIVPRIDAFVERVESVAVGGGAIRSSVRRELTPAA